jgi:hypothetical protein
MKLEFSRQIFEKKKLRYEVSSKSVEWEQSSVRTDGHEINSRFSQFCEAPKNQIPPDGLHYKIRPVHKLTVGTKLIYSEIIFIV